MSRVVALLLAVGLAFFIAPAEAQPARPNVFVSFTGEDAVGRRLAYDLRTQIATSPMVALTDDQAEALIRVNLITIGSDSDSYSRTSYSVVITLQNFSGGFDYYYDHYVGYCGSSVVSTCARDVLTSIIEVRDDIVGSLQRTQ